MTLSLFLQNTVVKTEDDMDYSDTQSPMNGSAAEESTQENTVDSTVHTDKQGERGTPSLPVALTRTARLEFAAKSWSDECP